MSQEMIYHPRRHLPLEGTYNVRDCGGYLTREGRTVKWGVFFRADGLHRLTPQGQTALLGQGVQTIIDLRRSEELQTAPNVFANSSDVQYHHVSLMIDETSTAGPQKEPEPLVVMYRKILDERQEQVYKTLATFADTAGLPGLVHCTAGKDRTGVITALLLSLVGVPHETIIADYALTSTYLGEGFMEDIKKRALQRGFTWEQYRPLVTCPPENMAQTLQHLDEAYGGSAAYLRHIGLSQAQLAHLRDQLLD
ncbi:protein-tyrosine-phosphatase [Candidatus Entotheonella serta]|nr:protein-tyrosine-phosphatase [Candidatus Entotheonella serta]